MSRLLVLGAGYVGAALGRQALDAGHDVVLADNWQATGREQLASLEEVGARVVTADIRDPAALRELLGEAPDVVHLLAAQASRPLADRDPSYTEQTNLTGVRLVAEAVAAAGSPPVVYGSSLQVYGRAARGAVGPEHRYGEQGDLAHLSKVYGELCLRMYATRAGFALAILRLGIVYGPGPVMHERPESVTVVDKFRRMAAAGEELPLDDGGAATIGVVHLEDAARIALEAGGETLVANVAAESVTVAGVASLARGGPLAGEPGCTYPSPFAYHHRLADYLAAA
ncbi:MAG: Nucleoside-diphosphate-sugar epimerase [Solirubrobacterales bacterium]|jgi:UDP-glucose 4-epimerase|nr:Nucleoside-diphosphate-sugar epimerase [Solirubrobacterales bacterium]